MFADDVGVDLECDRSFTRSDALAKHMRTVHETEALRPSDPIPKSHPNHPQNIANAYTDALLRRQSRSGAGGISSAAAAAAAVAAGAPNGQGFRVLNLNAGQTNGYGRGGGGEDDGDTEVENAGGRAGRGRQSSPPLRLVPPPPPPIVTTPGASTHQRYPYPPTDPFSPTDEAHRPPRELYKYLKQKLKWAQTAHVELERELEGYIRRRREAWVKKELLLDRCLRVELGEGAGASP